MKAYFALFALFLILVTSEPVQAGGFFDRIKNAVGSSSQNGAIAESLLQTPTGLTQGEIGDGLREALRVGTEQVVAQLGQRGGFNDDSRIHIPLPGSLAQVDRVLGRFGMSGLTDDLEMRLNHAAEVATPKAKKLFINAISEMSIEDAHGILTGPNDAATSYLRSKMGPELEKEMQPIVRRALNDAGAMKAYNAVMKDYDKLPYMPDVKADLRGYVVDKAMDGIFYYVAKEEADIRANPAARTTDILKRVFAAR